jgi:hypothetical protein
MEENTNYVKRTQKRLQHVFKIQNRSRNRAGQLTLPSRKSMAFNVERQLAMVTKIW